MTIWQHSGRTAVGLIIAATLAGAGMIPRAGANERALPMHFDLRQQGPAESCGTSCKILIAAVGSITADTPRDFQEFVAGRNLAGATVVLDSDGGSVHGAIKLGRAIRRLGLDTTVGTLIDLKPATAGATPRATLSPHADCESMCAFVLVAGVHRTVSPQSRVMVHQIWLGDRRDDPTAANYSAEDLVLVQRDIGRLARYTADMGASIDLLDLALRIPPWEPMHVLSADELRSMHVANTEPGQGGGATVAASAPAAGAVTPVAGQARAAQISERRWAIIDRPGGTALARRQPLTVEGEDIGSFDLFLACGPSRGTYELSYLERRRGAERRPLPAAVATVMVSVGSQEAPLPVVSSGRGGRPDELVTYASGPVPAAMIDAFGAIGSHSLTVKTRSSGGATGIRLGNTGVLQGLPQLAGQCANKVIGDRADLPLRKTGGHAAAR